MLQEIVLGERRHVEATEMREATSDITIKGITIPVPLVISMTIAKEVSGG